MRCLRLVSNTCYHWVTSDLSIQNPVARVSKVQFSSPNVRAIFSVAEVDVSFDMTSKRFYLIRSVNLLCLLSLLTTLTNASAIGPDGPAVNWVSCSNPRQLLGSCHSFRLCLAKQHHLNLPTFSFKHGISCSPRNSFFFNCRTLLRNGVQSSWS